MTSTMDMLLSHFQAEREIEVHGVITSLAAVHSYTWAVIFLSV